MADSEGFFGGLEGGLFRFMPRLGIERVVAGEFEEAELVGGKPGSAAGVGHEGALAIFENLGSFTEAAALAVILGEFPGVVVVLAEEDPFGGEFYGRLHFGDVEELSVGFGAVPAGPDGVEFAAVFERGHVDGPEVLFVGVAGFEWAVEGVFAEGIGGF